MGRISAGDSGPYSLNKPFACLIENDEMPQRWNLRRRFIGDRFQRAKFSAAISSGSSEERFCVSVIQPRYNRRRAKTGEERKKNRSDFNDRQHRDDDFWHHWH